MKYILKTATALLAAGLVFTACEDDETAVGFDLDVREITVGAEGGTERVRLDAAGSWIATTESPWITVSPTNGQGSVDCRIKIDTTLLADDIRQGTVRFMADAQSEPIDLRITQTGFERMITLSKTAVELPDYGAYGNRTFEVELTSNVNFTLDMSAEAAQWVKISDFDFELDRGARPRTVKLRVNWENNTRPWEREALIKFVPAEGEKLARQDELSIRQVEAPAIQDNREGDSLAVIGCARSLGYDMRANEGESMNNWDNVKLWEATDEGVTEDKLGRVRAVSFSFVATKEGIPYEIQFLTKAEEIVIYSNGNGFLRHFNTGEYLAKLTQLKRLQIFAFGISEVDESFGELKNLEVLDLSGNTLNKVPDVLTPENFPNLRHLDLAMNRRYVYFDLSTTTYPEEEWGGLNGSFPKQLLRWEKLEYLGLSNNLLQGPVPDMEDYEIRYTEAEVMANDTLPNGRNNPAGYNLIGKPKVLPNAKVLRINLNLLNGEIPEWILYHPNLMWWDPDMLVFNQDYILDKQGKKPGFTNVPLKPDYYYEAYPLKKPEEFE